MALPCGTTGITKPDFCPCSTCQSRSQAPLCLYTLRMISIHSEGTFGRLRYSLGGDRPSQTAHLTLSPPRAKRGGLEWSYSQGSIPLLPPRMLKRTRLFGSYLSCTSGTNIPYQVAVKLHGVFPSCRGVTCIFTGTIISPSLSLRQCPDRCAFRRVGTYPTRNFATLGPL